MLNVLTVIWAGGHIQSAVTPLFVIRIQNRSRSQFSPLWWHGTTAQTVFVPTHCLTSTAPLSSLTHHLIKPSQRLIWPSSHPSPQKVETSWTHLSSFRSLMRPLSLVAVWSHSTLLDVFPEVPAQGSNSTGCPSVAMVDLLASSPHASLSSWPC